MQSKELGKLDLIKVTLFSHHLEEHTWIIVVVTANESHYYESLKCTLIWNK